MGRNLLAVFAGLVVGLAVGLVLFPENTTSPDVEVPTLQRSAGNPESAGERAELARPPAIPSIAVVPEERALPLPARTESDPVQAARGTGEIWGRVTDIDGVGVADVLLHAKPNIMPSFGRPAYVLGQGPQDTSLVRVARDAARYYTMVRAGLSEGRTDATGHFRLEGLSKATFAVSGYKSGFVIESTTGRAHRLATGIEIGFTARAVQSVPLRVLLPNGELAEQAMIRVETNLSGPSKRARPSVYRWTREDDTLFLSPGTFGLRAMAGKFLPAVPQTAGRRGLPEELQSALIPLEVVSGATVGMVALQLKSRTGIRGRMIFPEEGIRDTAGKLHLLRLSDGQPLDLEALLDAKPVKNVRGGRRYEFLDLAPGRYALGLEMGRHTIRDRSIVTHRIVDVSSGIVNCDIDIPPLDLTGYLIVRVLGPKGEVLNDVRITVRTSRNGRSAIGGSTRDADGNYMVRIYESVRSDYFGAGSDDSSFQLQATHRLYGTTMVELSRGQTEVEVRFTQPAKLEVLVTGYVGSSHTGRLFIEANRPDGSPIRRQGLGARQEKVGDDGVLQLGALEPGPYVLTLLLDEGVGGYGRTTVAAQRVQLAAGDNTLSIALPPLFALEVVIPGAESGTEVSLQRKAAAGIGSGGWRVSCDAAGAVRFEDLIGGEYTIHVGGGIRGRMRIQIPCGRVVFEADGQ